MKKLISTVLVCGFITVVTAQDTIPGTTQKDPLQNPVTDTVPEKNNNDTSFYKTDPQTEDSTIYNKNNGDNKAPSAVDKTEARDNKNAEHNKQDKAGDRVFMRDNKMFLVKNGKTTSLTKSIKLDDGSIVMPDGTVKLRDGSTLKLNNGEHIKLKQ